MARVLAGAAFLGAITDAMLLGHWYLVQPGLPRRLNELVRATMIVWPIEVGLLLLRPGMVQVLNGSIDDGWDGVLGWFWVACAITTIVLLIVTRAALRERATRPSWRRRACSTWPSSPRSARIWWRAVLA